LSNWLRRQFRRTNVPEDEQQKLDELRQFFDDKSKKTKDDDSWDKLFKQLEEYKREYHTLAISRKDIRNRKLYYWVAEQRRREAAGKLLPTREEKLTLIGFFSCKKNKESKIMVEKEDSGPKK